MDQEYKVYMYCLGSSHTIKPNPEKARMTDLKSQNKDHKSQWNDSRLSHSVTEKTEIVQLGFEIDTSESGVFCVVFQLVYHRDIPF